MSDFFLAAAGNVEVPAYLALRAKGYTVRCVRRSDRDDWYAMKPGVSFEADGPIELLGLVGVYETRGTEWRASDDEIEAFMHAYDHSSW